MMTDINPDKSKKSLGLWGLFNLYWKNSACLANILLIFGIAATAVVQVLSLVTYNYLNKLFFDALQGYETSRLMIIILVFFATILILSITLALNGYFVGLLSLKWRAYLTGYIKNAWLSHRHYHHLQQNVGIDNPEQRITDDLNLTPQLSITIINQVFQATISIIIFGCELWVFSRQWHLSYHGVMLSIPGLYLWVALAYATCFNIAIFTLGHKLIGLNYVSQKLTANMRHALSLIRENSHKIALQNLESYHSHQTDNNFSHVVTNALSILRVDRLVQFVRQLSFNASGLIIMLIALPAYFMNHLQIGYLMQLNGAAIFFVQGLSVLIVAYENIAQLRASRQRTTEMLAQLNDSELDCEPRSKENASESQSIIIKSLALFTPTKRLLASVDALSIHPGKNYVLLGGSGAGRTALLQAMAGHYPYYDGHIARPASINYQFIPQDVFLPHDELLNILTMHTQKDLKIQTLCDVLKLFKLKHLIQQLHVDDGFWQKNISLQEKQRLAMAQAFLSKPDFLFIDCLESQDNADYFTILIKHLPTTTMVVAASYLRSNAIFDKAINLESHSERLDFAT